MSTIRDTINAFRHFAEDRDGKPADEHSMPNRLVYHFLRIYNNTLTSQLKNNPNINTSDIRWDAWNLPCVELEELDVTHDIPAAPPSGCMFLRSKYPIPETYEGRPVAVTVLAAECPQCDGHNIEFEYVQWNLFKDKIASRMPQQREGLYYTTKLIGRDRHLYIYTNSRFSEIRSAVASIHPKDMLDVLYFPKCGEGVPEVCDVLDVEFRIPMDIEPQVFAATLQALMQFRSYEPRVDAFNNTNKDNANPIFRQPQAG